MRSGVLPAVRVGGRYEVSEAAIAKFLATRRSIASVPADPGPSAPDSNPSREDVLEELEAMATDPVISCTSVVTFAARRGHDVVGDGCMVVIMNSDGRRVDYSALHHESPVRIAMLSAALGLIGAAPEMGCNAVSQSYFFDRTIRVPHVPQDAMRIALVPELRQYLVQYPVHSLMAAPISVDGTPVGFVAFARDAATRPYSAEDEAYMVRFADRIGALGEVIGEIRRAWQVRAEIVEELRSAMMRDGIGHVPSEDDVRSILAGHADSPFLISVFDPESRFVGTNETFTAATGYREEDIRSMPTDAFVRSDDREAELANAACLVSGEFDYHDVHGHRRLADGSEIFVAVHRAAVRAPDATLGGIVSVARIVRPFEDSDVAVCEAGARRPGHDSMRIHAA